MNALAAPLDLDARVRAAARGDVQAYEALVRDHRRLVATISLAIVGEVAASEDVAQEVFVAAWRGLPRLNNTASFLPWLRQTTRNRAHKLLEARKRRREARARDEAADALIASVADPRPSADALLVGSEQERALGDALAALPDESREVLTLFYREGQSVRQVATLLGLAEDATKKRLSRAREKLRADVLERFGHAAEQTAPGDELTRAVMAALPAWSGAGALGGKLSGALGRGASVAGGALFGSIGGLAGVFFGTRGALRRARDRAERREIVTLGAVQAILLGTTIAAYARLDGWPALLVGVGFLATLNAIVWLWLPRVQARRHAAERAEDAGAAARHRREIALSRTATVCGTGIALAAFLRAFFLGG